MSNKGNLFYETIYNPEEIEFVSTHSERTKEEELRELSKLKTDVISSITRDCVNRKILKVFLLMLVVDYNTFFTNIIVGWFRLSNFFREVSAKLQNLQSKNEDLQMW